MTEYENEPVPGLPANLPAGEHIVWQGSPNARQVARRVLFIYPLAAYFAVLMVWSATSALWDGAGLGSAIVAMLPLLALGIAALGITGLAAWLIARTTIYTITNKRIMMRYGLVLPVALNLPFGMIQSVGARRNADGTGDIALDVSPNRQLTYLLLWPHVRQSSMLRAAPVLCSVADVATVSAQLGRLLAATTPATTSFSPMETPVAADWLAASSAAPDLIQGSHP